jgi:hypothetical protein
VLLLLLLLLTPPLQSIKMCKAPSHISQLLTVKLPLLQLQQCNSLITFQTAVQQRLLLLLQLLLLLLLLLLLTPHAS